jgi:hypothetical protein
MTKAAQCAPPLSIHSHFSSAPYIPPITYDCKSYDASAATGGQKTDVSKRSIAQYFTVVHATFLITCYPLNPAIKQLAHPLFPRYTAGEGYTIQNVGFYRYQLSCAGVNRAGKIE